MNFADYMVALKKKLRELYSPKMPIHEQMIFDKTNQPILLTAGHDWPHCDRMARIWGPRIHWIQGVKGQGHLNFDMNVFEATCWLHNLDRAMGKLLLGRALENLLDPSPFGDSEKALIRDAIARHSEFADQPTDSTLLTALKIADKVDRLAYPLMGMLVSASCLGIRMLLYNPDKPFRYESTADLEMKTVYDDLYRQLEWYGMLPSDDARALVPWETMAMRIGLIRQYAREVAEITNQNPNGVEDDLRRALGSYYERFSAEMVGITV